MNQVLVRNYESYLEKLNRDIREKQGETITLAEKIDRQVASDTARTEKPRSGQDIARPRSRAERARASRL
jgi:hypothetical protein